MADYGLVPRALRGLSETVYRGMAGIGESRLKRADIGLEEARTGFEIKKAEEERAHREKVFGVEQERYAEQAPIREANIEQANLTGETARKGLEKLGREKRALEEPVTHSWLAKITGVRDPEDLINRLPNVVKGVEEGYGAKADQTGVFMTAQGPLTKRQIQESPDLFNAIDLLNRDYVYQLQSEMVDPATDEKRRARLKEVLKDKEHIYATQLDHMLSLQAHASNILPEGQQKVLQTNIDRIKDKIKYHREQKGKEKLERIKQTGKGKEAEVQFQYWNKDGKKHTVYLPKATVPAFEKAILDAGGGTEKPEKPEKGKELKVSDFNSLIGLIDKYTDKGERELTPEQKKIINDAANTIGYEYKEVTGKIMPSEKRWYWTDPETKKRWTLVKSKGEPGGVRHKIEKPKSSKPKSKKSDPLGIRQ